MKIIDVNILLYAVNENSDPHLRILHWWHRALSGDESIGLAWIVLCGFLRISTNRAVFPQPLTGTEASGQVERWLSSELTTTISEKPDHWPVYRELLKDSGTAGNLTTDAHLATLAVTHDATLVSCDNDFARFKGLRWLNPLKDKN